MSCSHLSPVHPPAHEHQKASTATEVFVLESVHMPPCWHGILTHSSTSAAQLWPSQPGVSEQLQLYASTEMFAPTTVESAHGVLCWHGMLKHSSMSSAQLWPFHPAVQVQLYVSGATSGSVAVHLPPCMQGLLTHSLTSTSQLCPTQPGACEQLQTYASTATDAVSFESEHGALC